MKKNTAPQRAETRTEEFARLLHELAALNPARLEQFGKELRAHKRRSSFPNKTS